MFGLCFRFGSVVPLYQLFGVLPALAVHGFQFHAAVQHTGPVNAPQAGTSGACGAAFRIYETEENAQRSAPLERMTF